LNSCLIAILTEAKVKWPVLSCWSRKIWCLNQFLSTNIALKYRRHHLQLKDVYSSLFWYRSENGELVCIATDESYFVLKYDSDSVTRARESKEDITEDGVETAFDVIFFQWTWVQFLEMGIFFPKIFKMCGKIVIEIFITISLKLQPNIQSLETKWVFIFFHWFCYKLVAEKKTE